jgi:hypothetical protein
VGGYATGLLDDYVGRGDRRIGLDDGGPMELGRAGTRRYRKN